VLSPGKNFEKKKKELLRDPDRHKQNDKITFDDFFKRLANEIYCEHVGNTKRIFL
jgi:hypothetical protein